MLHFRPRGRTLSAAVLLTLAASLAPPRLVQAEPQMIAGVRVNVVEKKLDNGLTLLMIENHQSPTVGLVMGFAVGSVDEWDGISGTAHILEHVLFKGTPEIGTSDWTSEKPLLDQIETAAQELRSERNRESNAAPARLKALEARVDSLQKVARKFVVSNEADKIYNEAGQQGFNAGTSWDMTSYQIALPSNRLELWMKLESDRLKTPVLREFYTELDNIMEERRLRTEDSPAGPLGKVSEAVIVAAYQASRYGVPIIGWPTDIKGVTRTEVEGFYRKYYAPNRMTIAIVGDIDPVKTHEMVQAYFGGLQRQPDPWRPRTEEPRQLGERRVEVEYDAEPRVILAWHVPAAAHADWPAVEVLNGVLQSGRSSRLVRRVVEEQKVAASINGYTGIPGGRYPSLYMMEATPLSPHTTADVEQAIYTEIDRLKREPPAAAEVEKVQTSYRKNFINGLTDNLGLASGLADAAATFGDWRQPFELAEAIMKVTPADVQRVAATYLTKTNRTVGTLVKPEPEVAIVDPAEAARGKALLDQARAAMGGKALGGLKDIRTTKTTSLQTPQGAMEIPGEETLTIDGRMKQTMSVMGSEITMVVVGDGGWLKTPQGVMDAPKEQVAEAKEDFVPSVFLLTLDPEKIGGAGLKVLPGGKLLEQPTDALEVTPLSGGKPFVVHLDPKTHQVVGMSSDGKNPVTGQAGRVDRVFSLYKPAGGVPRPTRTQAYMNGQIMYDETITATEVNGGVKPEEFARPS